MGASRYIERLVACFLLCVLPAGALAADEPLQLAPVSNWVMDYADDSCALHRTFEGGGEQATLELRQSVPGEAFRVIVASKTLSRGRDKLRVRFEPDAKFYELSRPTLVTLDIGAEGVLYTDSFRPSAIRVPPSREQVREAMERAGGTPIELPDPPWTDQERDLREISITGLLVLDIFERDFQMQTGEMHAPMEAMRTCLDELLTHWGLDPRAQRTLSRKVAPVKQSEWSRRVVANYPIDMLRAARSADIHIRLMVGADGTPTACMPYDSTPGNGSFERSACAWSMQFARFEPALDANGTPVASYYTTTIFYRVSR